jgi:hypothetical protein
MILGALGMVVANAAAILGARRLLQPIRTNKPSVDVVLFLLLRTLLISAAILIAGTLGFLTPLALGSAAVLILATLLALGYGRLLRRPAPLPWKGWLVALAMVLLLKLLLQVWFFAPYTGDVVSYHLPKIAEWIRAGAFTRELGLNPRVTLPAGFELLETWWVVFLRHDALIEMAGVEMLLLAAAAVYAISRELQSSPSVALGAAILFALTPGLQMEATSTLNDVAATAMTVATAALLLARADWPLLLLVAGLGTGIKPTYVYALPGLAVLAVLLRREDRVALPSARAAWTLAGVALAVGASWYLRNLLWFGNPVYPMGTDLGRQVQQMGPSLQSLRENLQTLVDVRIYDRFPVGALHTGNANWGAVAFACGMPALIAELRGDVRLRKLAIGFGLSTLTILCLVTLDAWNMRFVLFVPAILSIASARVAASYRPLGVVVAAAASLCFISTLLPSELSKPTVSRLLSRGWRERSAQPEIAPLPQEGAVGCAGDELSGAYWLYQPDFSRRVVYLRETSSASLLERLNREDVRVLYLSPRAAESAALREALAGGRWQAFIDGMGKGFRRVR